MVGPGRVQLAAAMGPAPVVMGLVLGQDRPQVPLAEDQHPVRDLGPGGHPEQVTDPGFLADGFFDARDAVQVKYEMVRAVTVDGAPVTATAAAFGYSRPSYYQAAAALAASGLDGLVPGKPGPRGGHKLTAQILAWAGSSWRPIRS